jgi:hypothetical protein
VAARVTVGRDSSRSVVQNDPMIMRCSVLPVDGLSGCMPLTDDHRRGGSNLLGYAMMPPGRQQPAAGGGPHDSRDSRSPSQAYWQVPGAPGPDRVRRRVGRVCVPDSADSDATAPALRQVRACARIVVKAEKMLNSEFQFKPYHYESLISRC